VFLVSRAWLDSPWCRRELSLAHRLNKQLFGVLIEDIPKTDLPAELKNTWQLVNLAAGRDHEMFRVTLPHSGDEVYVTFSAEGLRHLKLGLEKAGLAARYFPWPPEYDRDRAPYRGLMPLEADDAGIFFGRDGQIIKALDQLRGLRENPGSGLMVIFGASGVGKSSFLRAGLWPRIDRDDRHFLALPVVRPERAAITGEHGFVVALERALKSNGIPRTRGEIRNVLQGKPEQVLELLTELANAAPAPTLFDSPRSVLPTIVLPIDQGEELAKPEGANEAERLIGLLAILLCHNAPGATRKIQDAPNVIVLITIRSEDIKILHNAKPLEGVSLSFFDLTPISRGAYKEVIEGPTLRLGDRRKLTIEPALIDALLHDVEEGGGRDPLPLLSFTLERLYLEYGGDGDLLLEEYEKLGRLRGSIESAVDRALALARHDPVLPKDRNAQLTLLRRGLIPWLAGIDPDTGEPRRRVAYVAEIPDEARALIYNLVEQRLLTTDRDRTSGEITIEPAHESLLRQWGQLQGWLQEDFGPLIALEGLKRAARDWAANGQRASWLAHRSSRLWEVEQVLVARPDLARQITQPIMYYVAACRQAVAEGEGRRRARRLVFGFMAVVCVAILGYELRDWLQELVAAARRH
jgi:hypothetical protein